MIEPMQIAEGLRGLAVPIESVDLDPRNVRVHDERNMAVIRRSLERFGQRVPLVARRATNHVIAGNARLLAARDLGWAEVAVIFVEDDDATATAYALVDNRSSDLSTFDETALAEVLAALQDKDMDLDEIGFSEKEVDDLLDSLDIDGGDRGAEEPPIPEPPKEPITKPGDLITLGDHRLLCGDSTKAEDVERLMDGEVAQLMVTDPPYGVAYATGDLEEMKLRNKRTDGLTVQNDNLAPDETEVLIKNSLALAPLAPGSAFYIFAPSGDLFPRFWSAVDAAGLIPKQGLAWVKDRLVLGRSDYHYQHESIIYGWKPGAGHYFIDDRTQTTVWGCPRPSSSKEHPTMKPTSLIERCLKNSSKPGWLVLDPFLGSGTTLLASEKVGRRCFGLEIDPAYCDVIVERWENLTGGKAVRP